MVKKKKSIKTMPKKKESAESKIMFTQEGVGSADNKDNQPSSKKHDPNRPHNP